MHVHTNRISSKIMSEILYFSKLNKEEKPTKYRVSPEIKRPISSNTSKTEFIFQNSCKRGQIKWTHRSIFRSLVQHGTHTHRHTHSERKHNHTKSNNLTFKTYLKANRKNE